MQRPPGRLDGAAARRPAVVPPAPPPLPTRPIWLHRRALGLRDSSVARIEPVSATHDPDGVYLRLLLHHRVARSQDELRTVAGVLHDTYADAARAAGLTSVGDDEYSNLAMRALVQ